MNPNDLLARIAMMMETDRVVVARVSFGKTKLAQMFIQDHQLRQDSKVSVLSTSNLKLSDERLGAPRIRVIDLDDLSEGISKNGL